MGIYHFSKSIFNMIIPPRCPGSGEIVCEQGQLSPSFWTELDFIQNPICNHCGYPLPFEIGEEALCTSCLENKPPFARTRSVFVYNPAIAQLILPFKHGDQTELAPLFGQWLSQYGTNILVDIDYIIPVPLHYKRFWQRRYNQAALIGQSLSKQTGIPIIPDALTRTKHTISQGHMKPEERQRNVRNAFKITEKYHEKLQGKRILLVDDVYTSGATLCEISKLLNKQGIAEVRALTLARAIKDQHI